MVIYYSVCYYNIVSYISDHHFILFKSQIFGRRAILIYNIRWCATIANSTPPNSICWCWWDDISLHNCVYIYIPVAARTLSLSYCLYDVFNFLVYYIVIDIKRHHRRVLLFFIIYFWKYNSSIFIYIVVGEWHGEQCPIIIIFYLISMNPFDVICAHTPLIRVCVLYI